MNTEKILADLVMTSAYAVIAGQKTITISTKDKPLKGFPRGELLSVNAEGMKNYAVCPVKVLAWVHSITKNEV